MAGIVKNKILAAALEEPDRARILIEAADDLLAEEGLEGLTIRAVLARTGLARRAFYERFQGKDDLVLAVFATTLRAAAIHFAGEAKKCAGPMEALHTIVSGVIFGQLNYEDEGGDRRGAALSREHLRLAQSRPEELQKALGPLLDLLAGQVAIGIEKGVMRKADPQIQAQLIYNLVSTTTHTVLLQEEGGRPDREARRALAEDIWEFCRRGVSA